RRLFEQVLLAVDLHPREALVAQLLEEVAILALAIAHDRSVDREAGALREGEDLLDDRVDRLPRDRTPAHGAVGSPHPCVEEAQVVVDLGDRPDRRARVARGRLLVDRDRRREAVDRVDVRLLHHLQELPRVGGERLDIPPLPLGVDRVEGEARLPGPRESGDADQALARQADGDVLEVVLPGAVNDELVGRHEPAILPRRTYVLKVLRLAPATEHEAAEREPQAERPDREAADGETLPPRRQALPAAERFLLLRRERLAAPPLPQRPAGTDAEVEVVEDFAAVLVRHGVHCSLLRPCQHASSTSPTSISARGRHCTSPRSSEPSASSWSGSTPLWCWRRAISRTAAGARSSKRQRNSCGRWGRRSLSFPATTTSRFCRPAASSPPGASSSDSGRRRSRSSRRRRCTSWG